MRRTLLLVGHGSSHNTDSSAPVYAHAARIRTVSDCAVRVAFWKEAPRLCDAWSIPRREEVFVVPMFLAEGYYTREVVPRELGLGGPVTRHGPRVIRCCAPVGAHGDMSGLVLRRALQTTRLSREERRRAALIVIGHGTERNATSSATALRITRHLRKVSDFMSVHCGFLDQEPRIDRVVEAVDAAHIVLVPFLLADGWHTRETIPDLLRLDGTRTVRDRGVLWYTPPVGTMPEVAWIALAQAHAAGMNARHRVGERQQCRLDISPSDTYRWRHERADEWHDDD